MTAIVEDYIRDGLTKTTSRLNCRLGSPTKLEMNDAIRRYIRDYIGDCIRYQAKLEI